MSYTTEEYEERITTQPLDDRDTTPWDEADGETITEAEDQEAYKQEREDERMDEHFAPSEPW